MKYLNKTLLVVILLNARICASAGDTKVYTCAGGGNYNKAKVTCNINANAVGDKLQIDTKMVSFDNKGKITQDTAFKVTFPQAGQITGFTFIPTKASAQNKLVKVILRNQQAETGAGTVIKVFTQRNGETLWTERATIETARTAEDLNALTKEREITLTPDGTAKFGEAYIDLAQAI